MNAKQLLTRYNEACAMVMDLKASPQARAFEAARSFGLAEAMASPERINNSMKAFLSIIEWATFKAQSN